MAIRLSNNGNSYLAAGDLLASYVRKILEQLHDRAVMDRVVVVSVPKWEEILERRWDAKTDAKRTMKHVRRISSDVDVVHSKAVKEGETEG